METANHYENRVSKAIPESMNMCAKPRGHCDGRRRMTTSLGDCLVALCCGLHQGRGRGREDEECEEQGDLQSVAVERWAE